MLREENRGKCKSDHDMHQDAEETAVATKHFGIVRSKVFNFYSNNKISNNCQAKNKK